MLATVNDETTTYQLDVLELATLHAAARGAKRNGAKVTMNDLRKAMRNALDSYCREVAATNGGRKGKGGRA